MHGWGMTETSPLGSAATIKPELQAIDEDERFRRSAMAGVPVPIMDIRLIGYGGEEQPWDGKSTGNVIGTQRLLEFARAAGVRQFVFASSSSVYGVNPRVPWREDDPVLMPVSPYAATKVSGELSGHVYSRLHGLRFIALRFFTAYGPRQRPDLAIHRFARLMLEGRPLPVYGDGSSRRDYTYVDDIVQGLLAAMAYADSPYEVINLGNNRTVRLDELVSTLERTLGVTAKIERLPEQAGDVPQTWASIEKARRLLGYAPSASLDEGIARFAAWLRADGDAG
jgi:UDP-glucuronate 4-epimerase